MLRATVLVFAAPGRTSLAVLAVVALLAVPATLLLFASLLRSHRRDEMVHDEPGRHRAAFPSPRATVPGPTRRHRR